MYGLAGTGNVQLKFAKKVDEYLNTYITRTYTHIHTQICEVKIAICMYIYIYSLCIYILNITPHTHTHTIFDIRHFCTNNTEIP